MTTEPHEQVITVRELRRMLREKYTEVQLELHTSLSESFMVPVTKHRLLQALHDLDGDTEVRIDHWHAGSAMHRIFLMGSVQP